MISLVHSSPLSKDDIILKQRRTETFLYEGCYPEKIGSFHLLGVQFNRFLADIVYVGGTAMGAVEGGRGGYALGSFNLGLKAGYPFFADVKVMIGGSGGGGVPVKGGVFIQPVLTVGYSLDRSLECLAGIGIYISLDNDFRASVINVGISWSFWQLYLDK